MAELDRRRIAAVLPADADLETVARLAAALDGDAHHRADAVAVEHLERVGRDDLLLDVAREEALLRVVPRDAEDRLREVVRAEGEELRLLGDLVRDEADARAVTIDEDLSPATRSAGLRSSSMVTARASRSCLTKRSVS